MHSLAGCSPVLEEGNARKPEGEVATGPNVVGHIKVQMREVVQDVSAMSLEVLSPAAVGRVTSYQNVLLVGARQVEDAHHKNLDGNVVPPSL